MIYFLMFYIALVGVVYYFFRLFKKKADNLKLVFLSFSTAVVVLLAWNFFLSRFYIGESDADGVSIILKSLLSSLILLFYSVITYIILVFCKK